MGPSTRLNCNCALSKLMRSVVPVPGDDYQKLLLVQLEPGQRIGEHAHKEHTVLYYPEDAAALRVTSVAGMVIYLPPGTPHSVPTVERARRSVAMLVDVANG